jgi:hypothetical protein
MTGAVLGFRNPEATDLKPDRDYQLSGHAGPKRAPEAEGLGGFEVDKEFELGRLPRREDRPAWRLEVTRRP